MTMPTWPAGVASWMAAEERDPILIADSHTQGNPTRIILGGVVPPQDVVGVAATREWLRDSADHIRRRLVHEPRGGGLTCSVLPVADSNPDPESGWDIGAVILEPGSYPPMCGHCMIGFATVCVELGLVSGLVPDDVGTTRLRILTPAGVVVTRVHTLPDGGHRVELDNVPAYPVDHVTVSLDSTSVDVDLLWGGDHYITVDVDALGLTATRRDERELTDLAQQLHAAFRGRCTVDPVTGETLDVYQVMFHQRVDTATWRTLVVAPPGQVDRSPCGTGASALLACLAAAGTADPSVGVTTRSIVGGEFHVTGLPLSDAPHPGTLAPTVSGSAFINGFHTVVADHHDPFRDGFAPLTGQELPEHLSGGVGA